jgi:threonyl-tRNA synthetase
MENNKLDTMRHSAAHLLASAVKELYPNVKLGIGPAIENGFYYDFDFGDTKISEDDLPQIEEKMRKIQSREEEFVREEISIIDAKKLFKNQPYKLELINNHPNIATTARTGNGSRETPSPRQNVTIYRHGAFVDLCRGPHVKSTQDTGSFKLLSVAGAYWRGSEKNKMLTRIYGTAFPTQKELESYLKKQEEAKKRDHRKLGKELEIYQFSKLVGPGLPLYGPNGGIIIEQIETFMKELQHGMGYDHVYTPHIAKEQLFQTSGHLQWFADGMYPPMVFEGEGKYYAKPMNCPFHIEIYKNKIRSYRDLPIRYAEFGTVYRYEKSGEISGLLRTRGFTQDDAHIFCREDQIIDEFLSVFDLTDKLLAGLGLKNHWHRLSLRGEEKEKYAGNIEQWNKATELIRKALEKRNIDYKEAPGEAAFYGPKLDIIFEDSLNREWQISTIQVDFLLPERFNLTYVDSDGQKKRPYMIHRAPLGSRERIIAVLIEHFAGAFPVWLHPTQAIIIPISEKQHDYTLRVSEQLGNTVSGVRLKIDDSDETLGNKIRKAQRQKIPYMLIVGDNEAKNHSVSVRLRTGEDLGEMPLSKFQNRLKDKILTKSLDL